MHINIPSAKYNFKTTKLWEYMLTKEAKTKKKLYDHMVQKIYIFPQNTRHLTSWQKWPEASMNMYEISLPGTELLVYVWKIISTSKFYFLKKGARNPIFSAKHLKCRLNLLLNIMLITFEILIYLLLFKSTTRILIEYILISFLQ